jgi:hypothetical protein
LITDNPRLTTAIWMQYLLAMHELPSAIINEISGTTSAQSTMISRTRR